MCVFHARWTALHCSRNDFQRRYTLALFCALATHSPSSKHGQSSDRAALVTSERGDRLGFDSYSMPSQNWVRRRRYRTVLKLWLGWAAAQQMHQRVVEVRARSLA